MADGETFVILAMDSFMQAEIIGTRTGRPFTTEDSAERRKGKLERSNPELDFVVIPISTYPDV